MRASAPPPFPPSRTGAHPGLNRGAGSARIGASDMPGEIQRFLRSIMAAAERRAETVTVSAWGKERTFVCFDLFDDSFVLEDGIWDRLENRDPVVLVSKAALSPSPDAATARVFGNVMTVTSGNHAVASVPLLDGRLWGFSTLPPEAQPDVMARKLVCANCVGDTFEISQRGASTADVVEMDEWLLALGYPMRRVVLADRVDETLEFYSRRGQEWRIKPLAWTTGEMEAALRGAVARIHSPIRYYHNVKGVHFLTFRNFERWGELARTDFPGFLSGLSELCGTDRDQPTPNLLIPKFQSHHEIEFFGVPPGVAERTLVPAAMDLWRHVSAADPADPRTAADATERFEALRETFRSLLADPALADEGSPKFLETLYRHLNGAVYLDEHVGMSRAFDDLRSALPGATYTLGNRFPHDGADPRTLAILDSLEADISHGDRIEYVNVYELRSLTERVRLGEGKTREIVFKTLWDPLPRRLIEKRLARRSTGYGAYTLTRTHAFRALGISYGRHRLLARSDGASGDVHYFTRSRYPGQPFSQLPPSAFHARDPRTGLFDTGAESADIVRAVIVLMGSAAAENLILKKYTPDGSARFAEGKEIIEFGYDVRFGKEMPRRVWLCSVRGTMGWPSLDRTEENLSRCFDFYLSRYARVAFDYSRRHADPGPWDIADAFWEGFAARTRQICWNYQDRREQFDRYDPRLFGDYRFREKWLFVLWALEEQRARLDALAEIFHGKFRELAERAGD